MKTNQEIAKECARKVTLREDTYEETYYRRTLNETRILAAIESATAEIIAKNAPEIAKANAEIARLQELTHYFKRNNGHPDCGSEVDRLKGIIDELSQVRYAVCKERNEAVKERDALRAEVEKLKFYIATTIQPDEHAKVIADLRAEVAKLREALESIVKESNPDHGADYYMAEIARAALNQGEKL